MEERERLVCLEEAVRGMKVSINWLNGMFIAFMVPALAGIAGSYVLLEQRVDEVNNNLRDVISYEVRQINDKIDGLDDKIDENNIFFIENFNKIQNNINSLKETIYSMNDNSDNLIK